MAATCAHSLCGCRSFAIRPSNSAALHGPRPSALPSSSHNHSSSSSQTERLVIIPPLLVACRSSRLEEAAQRNTSGEPSTSSGAVEEREAPRARWDSYDFAGRRVQELVRTVGSGEDEMLDMEVTGQDPNEKLQSCVAVGGLITIFAVIISTLARQDPWGGTSLSLESAHAAAIGALVAIPLVALRELGWRSEAKRVLPLIEDMHRAQQAVAAPWLTGMNIGHVCALLSLEVLPLMLLLLPAAQAVVAAASGLTIQDAFDKSTDMTVSLGMGREAAIRLFGLVVTASAAGIGSGLQIGLGEEETQVVMTAVENADRFYRLEAPNDRGSSGSAGSSLEEEGAEAAAAFKAVALLYLDSRNKASSLAGALSFADVVTQGLLWYATGSLAAPATAALAINFVDYYHMHENVNGMRAKSIGGDGA